LEERVLIIVNGAVLANDPHSIHLLRNRTTRLFCSSCCSLVKFDGLSQKWNAIQGRRVTDQFKPLPVVIESNPATLCRPDCRSSDPVASLKNNDIPTLFDGWDLWRPGLGEPERLSGPYTLDYLKKTLFTPPSAKQSQWLARTCAWYWNFEQNLVNGVTDTSTKEPYVIVDRPVNEKRVPGANAQLKITFEVDFEGLPPQPVSI
jgi:hypothetical protein